MSAETNPTVEYFATVTAIAEDIAARCRAGDCDDIHDAIYEDVEGCRYCIYTHAFFEVRIASSHWGEVEDEQEWSDLCASAGSFDALAGIYAFHAMRADVEEAIREIDGFDPDDPDSWTATSDEQDDDSAPE